MYTVKLPMMNRLLQIAGLSGEHAKYSIPHRPSYLKHGWFIMFQCRNHKKYILQFFSSELSSAPTASSQSLSLSHSHDFMIHWPVVHWNWSAEHCCGAKVATQHRK
jgi:hypothetical protein